MRASRRKPGEGPITRLDPIQCELLYPRSPSTPIPGVEICSRVGAALLARVHYTRTTIYRKVSVRGSELERQREKGGEIYSVQWVVSWSVLQKLKWAREKRGLWRYLLRLHYEINKTVLYIFFMPHTFSRSTKHTFYNFSINYVKTDNFYIKLS